MNINQLFNENSNWYTAPAPQLQVTEGKVKELDQDLKDKSMTEQAFKNKYGKTRAEVRAAMKKPGSSQKLSEAGEWKAEADDFMEWSNHVKDTLLGVSPSQRFAMAKKLSQIETKYFGNAAQTGYNPQTGRPDSTSGQGMTTTVQHILDAINNGKLTAATTPAATAAIASAGTTQQTPFGSVTRPAGQPDPYQASPALAAGDRPAAQAAQNRPRPQQGSGSIKILKTEEDWEEALSNQDSDEVDPDTPAGFSAAMAKLPSWKIMLTTILLALKMPIIGDKLRKVMVSKMQENFGVTMSPKEVLEYMGHVRNTEPDQIIPPAVWKFEKDGGDYETALEQLPDDAVEVRPAEVMSTIATGLIDAGLAQEIKPGDEPEDKPEDETPSDAGAGAFGSMASQLTKKNEPVDEGQWIRTDYGWAGGSKPGGGTYKHPDTIKAERAAREKAKREAEAKKNAEQGIAEGSNVESQIKRIKDRILQLQDWNTAGTHDKKIKELQAKLKELQKQGVAEAANKPRYPQTHVARDDIHSSLSGDLLAAKGAKLHKTPGQHAQYRNLDTNKWIHLPDKNMRRAQKGVAEDSLDEVSDETLTNYMTKVDADSRKHKMDPTRRSPEKRSRSVTGFTKASDKLDSRKEQGVAEGDKVGNMDADKFDAAMARLKQLAGAGPMRTVYDPTKRVYKNVPTAQQPGNKK